MKQIVLHALSGVEPPIIARVSGDSEALRAAAAGLPDGAATPEAIAIRANRAGYELSWGEPEPKQPRARVRFSHARGVSSIQLMRADPTLLPDLQLGSYFDGPFTQRAMRRLFLALPMSGLVSTSLAEDSAFWRGVRRAASPREWQRLTRSSYVVLYYHRVAARKPGQERLNVSPEVFKRQMRWLRRLGLRPLRADEVIRFHTEPGVTLPRRAIVLCADDAFQDALVALRAHVELRPIVFVPTAAVGAKAPWPWADGEPIASWPELQAFAAAGGTIASHARSHLPLPELDPDSLADELAQSMRELSTQIPQAVPLLAYPHGQENDAVRAAAAAAGYRAAFTTRAGRNGAGTDRYQLRRIGSKDWDGAAALAWKALTGEGVPWTIERWRLRRHGLR